MQWLYLGIAVVAEVIATSALKAAEGFTRLTPNVYGQSLDAAAILGLIVAGVVAVNGFSKSVAH